MKKTLHFSIEAQTENREIISICHLNETAISLDVSPSAKKLFKRNRNLFNKINNSTKILTCTVSRQQITATSNSRNKVGNILFDNHDFHEKEIISASFADNVMIKTKSALFGQKNKKIYYTDDDILTESLSLGLDVNNITEEDVKQSLPICEIEELNLFQKDGIKTYMLKDFLSDARGLSNVSYKISFDVTTSFEQYIKFICERLMSSIDFLSSYTANIEKSNFYDPSSLEYDKSFRKSLLDELGVDEDDVAYLNSSRIKNSDFGQAALNYYNASLLLGNTSELIYGEILRSILPLSRSSIDLLKSVISKFHDLLLKIRGTYSIATKPSPEKEQYSKINSTSKIIPKFIVSTTERLKIDSEPLGYNVFSENQSGLNKFTIGSYRQRIGAEQSKYYSRMNLKDESGFMTNNEVSSFNNIGNAASYVTPLNLVLKDKKIGCTRGMNNVNVLDVLEFRIAKSAKASKSSETDGLGNTSLSKGMMALFNIDIGSPATSLIERSVDEEIDSKIDARKYVGDASFFITNDPVLVLKNFSKLIESKDSKVISLIADIIPNTFLRQQGSIRSINDLQLSNKNSRIRNLVSSNGIDIQNIPPQVKGMMTQNFQNNLNVDPFKNSESRAVIEETQKNIFIVKALIGFGIDADNIPDLKKPIYENMDQALTRNQPVLAKAYNHDVPELGILKDKFMPTIYSNLMYIGV